MTDLTDPYAHIRTTLAKYDAILDNFDVLGKANSFGGIDFNATGHAAIEDLLQYMMDHFVTPTHSDAEYKAVFDLFYHWQPNEFRNIPPTLLETVIPVAIIRDMGDINKIWFYTQDTPSWELFRRRYETIVLSRKYLND